MRRRIPAAATALVAAILMSGCGSGETGPANADDSSPSSSASSSSPSETASSSSSASASASPKPAGPALNVRIAGSEVAPNGKSLQLPAGKPLTISFKTDRAGELHVHSKPEQFVEFPAGTSTKKLTIDVPGVVEVEEHDTSRVVAQIEVR